ncbi:hypothetical protein GCM10025857_37810 [Alicyclobacillus contaminans]|nr:hypothetical protein GCM10025857_37810 [Alicyclobacillus contaminans]
MLLAHLAKANPQWRTLHGQSALVVFQGPHAYISPSWYETPASVPTWNYVAVHVYGTCQVVDSQQELAEILEKTIRFYEPDSLLPTEADEPFYRKMMQAIVGIRIRITHMEGAAKLSQNKSPDVQQRVIARLRESGDAIAQRVADWMQHQWHRTDGT